MAKNSRTNSKSRSESASSKTQFRTRNTNWGNMLTVRIESRLLKTLNDEAKARGISRSDLVRDLLSAV